MLALILLVFCTMFTQTAQQKIVFLHGTSSVGKSSLSAHVASHENWKVVASLYWDYLPKIIKERFPEHYEIIAAAVSHENITYAVYRNCVSFKENLSDVQKHAALESINAVKSAFYNNQETDKTHWQEFKQYTFDALTTSFKSGASTLIDLSWYVTVEDIKNFYEGDILQALIYCPLEIVIKRIVQRNQEAAANNTALNTRFFKFGISSFLHLYDLSENATGAIDTITKTSIEQIFELIAAHIDRASSHAKEFSLVELEEQRETLLQKFSHISTLYVVPRVAYDVLINTQELSPEAAAQKIIEY